jgi:hypothetical protein
MCLHTSSFAKNISIGTIEVGGGSTLNINSYESELENSPYEDTIDTTILSADALYYVRPNLGVGATWYYSSAERSATQGGVQLTTETMTSVIGPMVSYNFSINEQTSLKVSGAFLKVSGDDDNNQDKSGFGWNTGGKLSYFLNEHISINGNLNYYSYAYEYDNYGQSVDFEENGFNFGVGFSVYLHQ